MVKTLLGLLKPVSGEIKFGDDLTSRDIGYLPQQTQAQRDFPATVREVVLSGCLNGSRGPFYSRAARNLANKNMEKLSVTDIARRSYRELSGGQQQRVAIARALAVKPRVLLLDEPLGALDLKLRREMQVELKKIQQQLGITFIYVTHDQEEALSMSDTVVVMDKGKIQQIGTPEDIYNEPVNAFVADFIGESNIFNGVMTGL